MQDLVILVADKNMQFALRGALRRPAAMGIRDISFDFRMHPGRDGGVRTSGSDVLAGEQRRFTHGLMVLDHEGCGDPDTPALALEQKLDQILQSVWGADAKTIVIDPEVDIWVWGGDNILGEILKWPLEGGVRDWLRNKGFALNQQGKPLRPKEALDALRPIHKQPRSSALYEKVTNRISLARCNDAAFLRLRNQLQAWFPEVAKNLSDS